MVRILFRDRGPYRYQTALWDGEEADRPSRAGLSASDEVRPPITGLGMLPPPYNNLDSIMIDKLRFKENTVLK